MILQEVDDLFNGDLSKVYGKTGPARVAGRGTRATISVTATW